MVHGLLLGEESLLLLVAHQAVVVGELGELAVRVAVKARVANVGNVQRCLVQRHYAGGGHAAHAVQARVFLGSLHYLVVGEGHGLLEQAQDTALAVVGEKFDYRLAGYFGGHFAAFLAAHAVDGDKQRVAHVPQLHGDEGVFVVLAHAAGVGGAET